MNTCPAAPRAGDPISATWMASLVRHVKSITPIQGPGVLLAHGPNGTVISAKPSQGGKSAGAAPHPFEVRWAGDVRDGQGGWIIYLTNDAVIIDGATIAFDPELGPAGDNHGSFWYLLPETIPTTGQETIYLILSDDYSGTENGLMSATFAAETPTDDEAARALPVAYVRRVLVDPEKEVYSVSIRQNLVGALVQTGRRVHYPFDPVFEEGVLDRVEYALAPFGRGFCDGSNVDDSAKRADGFVYLRVDHPTNADQSASGTVCGCDGDLPSLPANTETSTYLPLYILKNGAIHVDFRCLLSLAIRE